MDFQKQSVMFSAKQALSSAVTALSLPSLFTLTRHNFMFSMISDRSRYRGSWDRATSKTQSLVWPVQVFDGKIYSYINFLIMLFSTSVQTKVTCLVVLCVQARVFDPELPEQVGLRLRVSRRGLGLGDGKNGRQKIFHS